MSTLYHLASACAPTRVGWWWGGGTCSHLTLRQPPMVILQGVGAKLVLSSSVGVKETLLSLTRGGQAGLSHHPTPPFKVWLSTAMILRESRKQTTPLNTFLGRGGSTKVLPQPVPLGYSISALATLYLYQKGGQLCTGMANPAVF